MRKPTTTDPNALGRRVPSWLKTVVKQHPGFTIERQTGRAANGVVIVAPDGARQSMSTAKGAEGNRRKLESWMRGHDQ